MKLEVDLGYRLDRVRGKLIEDGLKGIFVFNPKDVLYLTGRETGSVLVTQRKAVVWVKSVYRSVYDSLYSRAGYPYDVRLFDEGAIEREIKKTRIPCVGVSDVGFSRYRKLRKKLGARPILSDAVGRSRMVKTDYEIKLIKRSCGIAVEGMRKAHRVVREGVRELDAAAEVEFVIRKCGSETPPFEEGLILKSGAGAADIHGHPGSDKIRKGLVVVDLGARFQGYYSDMTRTLGVGRLNPGEREIKEFVRNIEFEAIDRISVGVEAGEVHDYVERRLGEGGFIFHHAAGHGIGLNVHERPSLGAKSGDMFEENMVFTVEPGVYVPKKFGVRFEDTVLLTKRGCRILTEIKDE